MAFEKVDPIDADEAAQHLTKCAAVSGYAPDKLTSKGASFRIKTTGGDAVFVLEVEPSGICWITAGEGAATDDLTKTGLALIELMAKEANCHAVGFKTKRLGLVKKAQRLGYAADEVHMVKRI